ncbi:MAG: adenylyltransferase/cytidyltransferase family protein [Halobacteriota archaeon]|jgi:FAD synthetase
MTRVLATGTFDILHPGHILYLRKAKELGDELFVIVSRDSMVQHKSKPILPEQQRLQVVQALEMVDHAELGSERDIFEPLKLIKPDIIALGFDQYFDENKLQQDLEKRHIPSKVIRLRNHDSSNLSGTEDIIREIIKRRVKC